MMIRPAPTSLIRRFQVGDATAFEELLRLETGPMQGYASRYIHSASLVEDVLQEAWLRIWRARESLISAEKYRGWMYQILRNTIWDQLNRQNWKLEIDFAAEGSLGELVSDPDPDPRQQAADRELRRYVKMAMSQLDGQTQEMLALHFTAGLKFREIGIIMNLPLQTVYSRISRALKNIRAQLEAQGIVRY